jgi:hypothetical protein
LAGPLAAVPGSGNSEYVTGPFAVTLRGIGPLPAQYDEVPETAAAAVEIAHRPDLDIRWPALPVFMTTHAAGDAVTELDLAMAARLDAIAAAHGAAEV